MPQFKMAAADLFCCFCFLPPPKVLSCLLHHQSPCLNSRQQEGGTECGTLAWKAGLSEQSPEAFYVQFAGQSVSLAPAGEIGKQCLFSGEELKGRWNEV